MIALSGPIAATSQKTYFSHERTLEWAASVSGMLRDGRGAGVTVIVIPPATALASLVPIVKDSGIILGAQDCSVAAPGPCTGELPGQLLREVGARVVEIGHAERRLHFGETDEIVAAKVAAAVAADLLPLVCVGEHERLDPPAAAAAVVSQLESALAGIDPGVPVIAGYEPVWAIGAEQPAGAEHVRAVCSAVGKWLDARSTGSHVIYGGTAGPGMFGDVSGAVDGLFLGRRVHDPHEFGVVLDEMSGRFVSLRSLNEPE